MTNNDMSLLLNDQIINRLTDIYLDFIGAQRNSLPYRRLKNAVILSAFKYDNMQEVYAELEKIEDISAGEIEREVTGLIENLTKPIEDLFNNAYCSEAHCGFMPRHKTTNDKVAFLGKTLLYILETNYRTSI